MKSMKGLIGFILSQSRGVRRGRTKPEASSMKHMKRLIGLSSRRAAERQRKKQTRRVHHEAHEGADRAILAQRRRGRAKPEASTMKSVKSMKDVS